MARKHSKYDPYEDMNREAAQEVAPVPCWLCGRPTGKTIVWHHPVPKSRGGRDVVPMHPICQQGAVSLIATRLHTMEPWLWAQTLSS